MGIDLLASLDRKLFLFLNSKHSLFFDYIMYWASNMFLWIPLYIIIFFSLIKFFRKKQYFLLNTSLIMTFIISLVVITYAIYPPIFEQSVHRVRPCYNPQLILSVHTVGKGCGNVFNFFVQKSCFAFALTTFLLLILPVKFNWLKIVLIVWALLLSYSRIYLGMHYPFNVLTAIATGIVTGFIIYHFYRYFKNSLLLI